MQVEENNNEAIVNVYPKFNTILECTSKHFQTFFWSELLLYKQFHNIERDIGLRRDIIIINWIQLYTKGSNAWHINCIVKEESSSKEENNILEKCVVDNNVDGIMDINE